MSSTGGSAGDPPPSPVLIVPCTPSARRSTEEIWNDINLSYLKYQGRQARPGHLSTMNCLDGFPGMNMERRGRYRGPSPASLSLGSPSSATTDPATCLSLYWAPSDPSRALFPPKSFDKRGSQDASAVESEDKRRKRLMKNRESADRSRARKQVSPAPPPINLFHPPPYHLYVYFPSLPPYLTVTPTPLICWCKKRSTQTSWRTRLPF